MEKQKDIFSSHKTAVFALFLLGQTGIIIPYKNGNENIFLAFLLASFIGFLILVFSFSILKQLKNIKNSHLKKYVFKTLLSVLAVYCFCLAVDTFNVFLEFLSLYVLPDISPYLLGLVFTALIIFISAVKIAAFYKFSLVTALLSAVMLVVLFLLSVPQFSIDNISLLSLPNLYDVLSKSLVYLKDSFLPVLILPLFEYFYRQTPKKSGVLKGYLIGLIMLTVCLLNSLLIFGNPLSSKLDFAYSEAIGTVTAGNIFLRMDGFSYFVFFGSCIVKICLLARLVVKILKDVIGNKKSLEIV